MCQGSVDKFPCHQSLQHNCEASYWPGRVLREHTWSECAFGECYFYRTWNRSYWVYPGYLLIHRISGYLDLFRRYSLWFTIRCHPPSSPNTFHLRDIHTSWNCDFAWGYYTMHFKAVAHIPVWQNENWQKMRVDTLITFIDILFVIIIYLKISPFLVQLHNKKNSLKTPILHSIEITIF